MDKKYDVAVIGGGTTGCACAWNCAKAGLKTVLIEKSSVLGGAMTTGLVVPMMDTGENQINTDFYENLVSEMKNFGANITFQKNSGWFNPEVMKAVLDKLLTDAGVEILFNTDIKKVSINSSYIDHAEIECNILSPYISSLHNNNIFNTNPNILSEYIAAKYYVDATGDGNFSAKINCQILNKNNENQPVSLRFFMGGVDIDAFAHWLNEFDTDRNVSPIEYIDGQIHLSAAYTWDSDKHWALQPLFDDAVDKNILKDTDRNYFQLFTVAGMPGTVAFNCPRMPEITDLTSVFEVSKALISCRSAILRLSNFCKLYLKGFENSYISNISDTLGVRVSRRIKGKYVYAKDDILKNNNFDNVAVISDYPIDVHSAQKSESVLYSGGEYSLPIESLMSCDYDNLFIAGRCLSADFWAQGALRVQKSCLSMGEAVAKYIAGLCN